MAMEKPPSSLHGLSGQAACVVVSEEYGPQRQAAQFIDGHTTDRTGCGILGG